MTNFRADDCPELFKSYTFGRCLGEGSQGAVMQVNDRKTGKLFAAKIFARDRERSMRREHMMMAKVRGCSGVAQFVRMIREKPGRRSQGSLVMKLYGQSLKEYLRNLTAQSGSMSERDVAMIVKKLAKSLQQIHARGVVHRDLKLENIFLEQGGVNKVVDNVVIGDFGLATSNAQDMSHYCGTSKYMAPEISALKGREDGSINSPASVDIWGLGVMAYELLGSKPDVKLRDNGEFHWPDGISNDAKQLVSSMLAQDPNERCPLEEVLKHPWIVENTKAPRREVSHFSRNCEVVTAEPGWSSLQMTVNAH